MKVKNISGQMLIVGRFRVAPGNFFPGVPFTAEERKGVERLSAIKLVSVIEDEKPAAYTAQPKPIAPAEAVAEAKAEVPAEAPVEEKAGAIAEEQAAEAPAEEKAASSRRRRRG